MSLEKASELVGTYLRVLSETGEHWSVDTSVETPNCDLVLLSDFVGLSIKRTSEWTSFFSFAAQRGGLVRYVLLAEDDIQNLAAGKPVLLTLVEPPPKAPPDALGCDVPGGRVSCWIDRG